MKSMSIIILSLFALTFGLCGNAMAAPTMTNTTVKQIGSFSTAKELIKVAVTCINNGECVDKAGNKFAGSVGITHTFVVPRFIDSIASSALVEETNSWGLRPSFSTLEILKSVRFLGPILHILEPIKLRFDRGLKINIEGNF